MLVSASSKGVYTPREETSASQLVMADRCWRSWVIRYLLGVKSDRRSRGQLLGSLIHACLDSHFGGRSVYDYEIDDRTAKDLEAFAQEKGPAEVIRLKDEAPKRAMAGLAFLPRLDECTQVYRETNKFILDTAEFWSDIEPIKWSPMSALDLAVQAKSGDWFIYDHKSTAGGYRAPEENDDRPGWFDPWLYVPTEEKLSHDAQLLLYALAAIQKLGLPGIWCRWVYYSTAYRKPPQACNRDVYVTKEQAVERLTRWIQLADKMRRAVRWVTDGNPVPAIEELELPAKLEHPRDSPCLMFRGCAYRGAICNPPIPLRNQMAATSAKKEEEKMNVNQNLANAMAGYGQQPPAPQTAQPTQGYFQQPVQPPQAPPQAPPQYAQQAPPAPPAEQYQPPPQQEAAPPKKRKRRTKAEMEAARQAEAAQQQTAQQPAQQPATDRSSALSVAVTALIDAADAHGLNASVTFTRK